MNDYPENEYEENEPLEGDELRLAIIEGMVKSYPSLRAPLMVRLRA